MIAWYYTVPKSERSEWTVPLLDEGLIAELTTLLDEHLHRADPDAGLWPGKVAGHPVLTYDRHFDPKGLYRYTFKPVARDLGHNTLRFHELRNTFASLTASHGVSMFELSRMMDHGSITVTDGTYVATCTRRTTAIYGEGSRRRRWLALSTAETIS